MGSQLACCASAKEQEDSPPERHREETPLPVPDDAPSSSKYDEPRVRIDVDWDIDGLVTEDGVIMKVRDSSGAEKAKLKRFVGEKILEMGKGYIVVTLNNGTKKEEADNELPAKEMVSEATQTAVAQRDRSLSPALSLPSLHDEHKYGRNGRAHERRDTMDTEMSVASSIPISRRGVKKNSQTGDVGLSVVSKEAFTPAVSAAVVSLPYGPYSYQSALVPERRESAPAVAPPSSSLVVPSTPLLHSSPAVLMTRPTPPLPAPAPPSPMPYVPQQQQPVVRTPSPPLITPTPPSYIENKPDVVSVGQLEWSDTEFDDVEELEHRLSQIKEEAHYIKGQIAHLDVGDEPF
eukprot:TRINITY_DN3340_c2_g3_i1.p1 TRINITY_DN3340_c2_g3~~TRINITY_DN3340_c2_g3_i1.p1  ORF type:complete len:348 (+),score=88.90 TRINITY_DN3340_c2_g3_i1:42-1085(+)